MNQVNKAGLKPTWLVSMATCVEEMIIQEVIDMHNQPELTHGLYHK